MVQDNSGKLLALSAAIIIVSIILLIWPAPGRDSGRNQGIDSTATDFSSKQVIHEVIDGDTFVLSDGSQIRLIGVDTPEDGQPYYQEAVDFARSRLSGTEVTLELDREPRDRYGRLLAYLFVDSLLFNETLIDSGLGSVYLFGSNRKFADRLIGAQKDARSSKTGIWSLPPPPPEENYINPGGSLRFHRPLCWHLKDLDLSKARRFSSRDEALDLGLSPCRTCRP